MNWADPSVWITVLLAISAVARVVTSLTPTPKDDRIYAKFYKIIEMLGITTRKTKE